MKPGGVMMWIQPDGSLVYHLFEKCMGLDTGTCQGVLVMDYNPEHISTLIDDSLTKEKLDENQLHDLQSLFECFEQSIDELLLCEGLEKTG
jgi:hypothetical protein